MFHAFPKGSLVGSCPARRAALVGSNHNRNTRESKYLSRQIFKHLQPSPVLMNTNGKSGTSCKQNLLFPSTNSELKYAITTMLMGRTLKTKIKWVVFKGGWSKCSLQLYLLRSIRGIYFLKGREGAESKQLQDISRVNDVKQVRAVCVQVLFFLNHMMVQVCTLAWQAIVPWTWWIVLTGRVFCLSLWLLESFPRSCLSLCYASSRSVEGVLGRRLDEMSSWGPMIPS